MFLRVLRDIDTVAEENSCKALHCIIGFIPDPSLLILDSETG